MSLLERFGLQHYDTLEGFDTLLSHDMSNKIALWLDMAQGKAPWNKENLPCGVLPSIVGAIADPVAEEMQIESKNEKLAEAMHGLDINAAEIVHNLMLFGSSVVRPIYSNGKLQYEIIKLGYYLPTHYDFDGTLTGAIILKKIMDGKKQFLLLEKHNYINRTHTVDIEIYRIDGGLFIKTTLSACSKTANLTKSYKWEDIDKPFIVEIRNPRANEIDGSQVPVNIFAGHENLIADADRQYNEINWEMIAGESRIFADEDLFRETQGPDGKKKKVVLPEMLHKVIVQLSGNGTGEQKIYTHTPTLRTEQQIAAYQQILREIENVCRIGKGTLSNLEAYPQTATQYTGGKKVLYNTVDVIESELENKYKHIAYIFAYMLSVYEHIPFDPELTITYNEADRKDPMQQKIQDMQEVASGIMSKYEYRMKHYGEDEATARANIPESELGTFAL